MKNKKSETLELIFGTIALVFLLSLIVYAVEFAETVVPK
jgi:hypothetical protein